MNNNTKNIIITILIILVIFLTITTLHFYNNKETSKTTTNKQPNEATTTTPETTNYTYNDIKGLYSFVGEKTNTEGNEFTPTWQLYLSENGTFNYKLSTLSSFGTIGNYIITDNKIILNYLFNTNSSSSLEITSGTKTLQINEDKTITDNNQPITTVSINNITLNKSTIEEESTFLSSNNIKDILNNYNITNNSKN